MTDYFRWVLLVVGLLLLAYIYFSGRSKRKDSDFPGHTGEPVDPLFTDHRSDRKMSDTELATPETPAEPFDVFDPAPADDDQGPSFDEDMEFFTPLEDMPEQSNTSGQSQKLFSSIAEKIEAFSARLTPKRKERMEASAARSNQNADAEQGEEKIISLNVMAPEGYVLDGVELYNIFLQRGYEHGEMGIFHSRYDGKTIFSIVNMIEPGSFDLDTIDTMQTPGVTLFLQLPGTIAADVLFEVLISEAGDIARALGGTVLDSQRSTLTKQTIQHLRESIYEYMHRQKYFGAKQR